MRKSLAAALLALTLVAAGGASAKPPAVDPPLLRMIKNAARDEALLLDTLMLAIESEPGGGGVLVRAAIAARPEAEKAILERLDAEREELMPIIKVADGESAAQRLATIIAVEQAAPPPKWFAFKSWDGELAAGASLLSGNTDEQAATASLKLQRRSGQWEYDLDASGDYSRNNAKTTKQRLISDLQARYFYSPRWFSFAQVNYEVDKFSEFDWRLSEAIGSGYRIYDTELFRWDIQGGPGVRQTKFAANGTVNEFIFTGSNSFAWTIRDNLKFSNDSVIFTGSDRTTISNDAGLTASLTERWSGRLSFFVKHDTSVPIGQEKTDTASRASLVYEF